MLALPSYYFQNLTIAHHSGPGHHHPLPGFFSSFLCSLASAYDLLIVPWKPWAHSFLRAWHCLFLLPRLPFYWISTWLVLFSVSSKVTLSKWSFLNEAFPSPSIYSFNSPPLAPSMPSPFPLSPDYSLMSYVSYLFILLIITPTGTLAPWGQGFFLVYLSLLYPHCLVHGRHFINIYWMNLWFFIYSNYIIFL